MRHRLPGAVPYLCLLVIAATLSACATGHELRETSKKFEDQTETVRSSLDSKIEQLKRTQVAAEKNLAKLEQLIEENKREQTQTRELAAKLNSDVRGFREMDLTKVEGRIERAKRDIEALQGKVEDQVSSLQQNAQQWLATLDQKQSAKLDQQVTKVDQQVAKVEARLEGLDKREAVASRRIEETLTTLGKKIDERLGPQEARIKKLEDDQRAATTKFTTHLGEVDKNLAQISDTVKTVGAKLSTQLEQQGGSLGKLEEATKQEDAQLRTLAPRVDQLKSSLGELAKVLHTLTEKSSEIDRRVTELSGQTEGKVGALAVQGGEQSARLEKLAKRLEVENQAVSGHLNTVTQSVNGLAKSLEGVQGRVGELQGRVGDASRRQDDTQEARIDALTKSLNETMTTVNDTTRAIGDLKHALDTSLGKLASRVDEQGDTLNKLALQQGVRTVSATQESQSARSATRGRRHCQARRAVHRHARRTSRKRIREGLPGVSAKPS